MYLLVMVKQFQQHGNVLTGDAVAMIKTPYILSHIQRKPFSSDATFGGTMPLEISPKTFKTIKVSALIIRELVLSDYAPIHNRTTLSPAC